MLRTISLASALLAAGCASLPVSQSADRDLKLNEIQVLGTHNSYSLTVDPQLMAYAEPIISAGLTQMQAGMSEERQAEFREYHPNFDKLSFAEGLNYGFPEGLTAQLDAGVRSLAIDIYHDPEGGRFLDPAGYRALEASGVDRDSLAPHDTEGLEMPGFKVLHMADLDFRSTCTTLTACLGELAAWSDANPDHTPVFVMLEAKDAGVPIFPGATEVLPFDGPAFDALDAELVAALGRDRIITPDDVRGEHATLEAAVLDKAWPSLADSRGKFIFLMLTALDTGGLSAYAEDRPNLEGRMAFTRSTPGQPHAAFLLLDNAVVRHDEIRRRVSEGYMVRTRSDIETYEAKVNDMTRAEAAFDSGAQIVSTDFYKPGNPYGTAYTVTLPGGGDMRCNPIATTCSTED